MRSGIRWGTVALACLFGAVIIGYFAVKVAPDLFASDTACKPGDKTFSDCLEAAKAKADDRRSVTTATLALFAGAISVFGAYVGARTFALNRDSAQRSHDLDRAGQITERFTRAIDQLGSEKLDVRLGGIYALERIARDSRDDHPQVVEVLTAYVREHARWRPAEPPEGPTSEDEVQDDPGWRFWGNAAAASSDVSMDVAAAVSVLGRRDSSRDRTGASLDLAGTNLRSLRLRADEANLGAADLTGANLLDASLAQANLEGASLLLASLPLVDLSRANLQGADLSGADLSGANLQGADLRRARFRPMAVLTGSEGWKIQHANLRGAELDGADFGGAELKEALYDDGTDWPRGFDYRAAGARHVDEEKGPDSVPTRD